jgi:diaminohydroxyphosphoribosylaminopyrimidine deaminase/5-amino-6-(5-phosphoribosylamino)uracil reductase
MTMADPHEKMMQQALELAKRGEPSPNPPVGCVIADGAKVVAQGHHEAAGLDHAEIAALNAAGPKARGKALYVTLEPCNHQGRTPPCVDAIITAGIKEVIIGCRDPNPSVTGGGIERLEAAGIKVTVGVLESDAKQLIKAWSKFITEGASFLSLKLALSLDGRIATRTGKSRWLTGEESRTLVHTLRAQHDAVMIGINTVLTDDPELTVRNAPGSNPARVIVDSKLRLPLTSKLVKTATNAASLLSLKTRSLLRLNAK